MGYKVFSLQRAWIVVTSPHAGKLASVHKRASTSVPGFQTASGLVAELATSFLEL